MSGPLLLRDRDKLGYGDRLGVTLVCQFDINASTEIG